MAKFEITHADQPLLEKLSESHREIILASGQMHVIADNMGIPVGTVKSRLHRARMVLVALRPVERV